MVRSVGPGSAGRSVAVPHAEPILMVIPGDPPRTTVVAVLGPVPAHLADCPVARIEVIRYADGVTLPARPLAHLVPLRRAIPWLLSPDGPTTPSGSAWASALRSALAAVARGPLVPALSARGYDAWVLGAADLETSALLAAAADGLPAVAHAVAAPDGTGRGVFSAAGLVRVLCDGIADTMVRTASVANRPGQALTTEAPVHAAQLAHWLARTHHDGAASPALSLHITLGADDAAPLAVARIAPATVRGEAGTPVDVGDFVRGRTPIGTWLGPHPTLDACLMVTHAAGAWPPVRRLADQPIPDRVEVTDDEISDLLEGGARVRLAQHGVEVTWSDPDIDGADIGLAAVVDMPSSGEDVEGMFGIDALLDYRWEATIHGRTLDAEEMRRLLESTRPLVRLRDGWVSAARVRRVVGSAPRRRGTGAEALGALLGGVLADGGRRISVRASPRLAAQIDALRATTEAPSLPPPPGLTATLRPYQARGVSWLDAMCRLGLGGCLADDMGLGKTVQVIALHLHRAAGGAAVDVASEPADAARHAGGPTLVVCPTSLLGTWEREIRRFAPGVPVLRHHGLTRHQAPPAQGGFVLVSYGTMRRDTEALAAASWDLVVADEAQHVKNPGSRTARALRDIPARARVALTGTPVENRLSDLWAILDWTTPGLLGTLEAFRREIAAPIERRADPDVAARLSRIVRPFLLRRRKSDPDVAPELPPRTIHDVIVAPTSEQTALYQSVVDETLARIRETRGIERRGQVFRLITALKQVCNHPAHHLRQDGPLPRRSGKLDALDEILDVVLAEGESALIFTQFVAMGRLISAHLRARRIGVDMLYGALSPRARDALVDRFQAGALPVLVLSLRAGGVGLTLTRATHVVHYDRWWNPAVEDQATDRAHRIGQTRPVQVHRLIVEGTLEDRIAAVIEAKRDLAQRVIGGGESWIGELSDTELTELVRLRPMSDLGGDGPRE